MYVFNTKFENSENVEQPTLHKVHKFVYNIISTEQYILFTHCSEIHKAYHLSQIHHTHTLQGVVSHSDILREWCSTFWNFMLEMFNILTFYVKNVEHYDILCEWRSIFCRFMWVMFKIFTCYVIGVLHFVLKVFNIFTFYVTAVQNSDIMHEKC